MYLRCMLLVLLASGCTAPWLRKPDPESPEARKSKRERIKEILASDNRPWILSEIASPKLLTIARMENLALVTCLAGTGGAVEAGPQRERMLDIMRLQSASMANQLLDSPDTAMVVAFANIPPAAREGSILDVGVKISNHAEATSLRMGWLMPAKLSEASLQGESIKRGFDLVDAQGTIVTIAQSTGSKDPQAELTGIVVGGGRLGKSRPLGAIIHEEFADAFTQAQVLRAINDRFTYFTGSKKDGVATPKRDNFLEVAVPPRYENDPFHYINVVLSVGFLEDEEHRKARIERLRNELLVPETSKVAAWQLEAIGKDCIPILHQGLDSSDPEVRFYSAYSLAHLNDNRAVATLARLAPQQAAFRAMCLNGLSIIDHFDAGTALEDLLHYAEPETRFGAMRALRHRDPSNAITTGFAVDKVGTILEIPSDGPPLVAVSLEKYPEVVIFGNIPRVNLREFEYINPRILIKATENNTVTISHFAPNEDDRVVQCQSDLRSVLMGIAEVGGNYGDWVSFLRECSEKHYIAEPVKINPVPSAGRVYDREKKMSVVVETPPKSEQPEDSDEALAAETQSATTDSTESTSVPKAVAWYNPFTWFAR